MARYGKRNSYANYSTRKNNTAYLRVLSIILPIVIVFVLAAGVYLAYKSLDLPKNESKSNSNSSSALLTRQDNSQLLKIVDTSHSLKESYKPELTKVRDVEVNKLAANNLKILLEDAEKEGLSLNLQSGYISFSDQQKLYENTKNKLKESKGYTDVKAESVTKKTVPAGGNSEAQTGLLVTFASKSAQNNKSFKDTKEFRWLEKKCINYGFVLRYPPLHEEDTSMQINYNSFRYVGIENAVKMRTYGMCLNEYAVHNSGN